MNTFQVIVLVCTLTSALSAADTDAQIQTAEKSWADATMRGDIAALEGIYSDRLIYAHSTGVVQTKAELIDQLKSGARRYTAVTHERMKVEPYGDSAVSHALARTVGNVDGKPFDDHVMVMHFWVKQGGKWRLAAHQTTKVP